MHLSSSRQGENAAQVKPKQAGRTTTGQKPGSRRRNEGVEAHGAPVDREGGKFKVGLEEVPDEDLVSKVRRSQCD